MDFRKVHLLISGHVQGVFFRAETKKFADSLRLCGWAKNLSNGNVEIYAIGSEKNLEKLIKWCEQGPSRAKVESVKVDWDKDFGIFETFEIIY